MNRRDFLSAAGLLAAAGTVSALAVKGGLAPRNVDPEAIRKELLAQKAFLG